jgi:hypothetical protein
VGTSSVIAADMKEQPNLTPWMANVFVVPTARRRSYVIPLKDNRDRRRGRRYSRSVLHTDTAEGIYAKAGWRTVEIVQREGGKPPATVMRLDLTPSI